MFSVSDQSQEILLRKVSGIHTNANIGCFDICGEVAAICHALAHGHREFEAIVAIWGDGKGYYELLSPCGRCREFISDFNQDTWVIIGSVEHPYKVKVTDLLPLKYIRSQERPSPTE